MKCKKNNRIAAFALVFVLAGSIFSGTFAGVHSSAATALAIFTFSQSDGVNTAKDLNDTYKANADSGYPAASGKYSSASKLFASVNSPSDDSYRKLEWSKDSSYTYNGAVQKAMPIMIASTKNPWGSSPFFLIKTSTKDYENLSISFRIGGTKKGPKEFKLQYSLNGTKFNDISNTAVTLKTNKTLYDFTFSLPKSTNDQSALYLKVVASSTATIEGSTLTADAVSGESAINNITLSGTASSSSSKETAAPTTRPSVSSTTRPTTNSSVSNNDSSALTSPGYISTKKLAVPKLTSYKKGTKYIKGTAPKKSKVTVTVGKKKYTASVTKKGTFKVKLTRRLKIGKTIKVFATSNGYADSKTKTFKVK